MLAIPTATLTRVAAFPEGYFLENLAARNDGSVLISAVLQKELWCVPGADRGEEVEPVLLATFDHLILDIVEAEPDIFIISLSDLYTTHESHLVRLDLNGWTPGESVSPELIFTFEDGQIRGLNGSCLASSGTMLIADCFAGLIWRVDFNARAHDARARVWLTHDTMAFDPDSGMPPPPQPGINGLHYSSQTGYLYYTSTAQKVFMRVPVDADTMEPSGLPEFVAAIDFADDFCVDDVAGVAYVARHRANTIDRVPLTPRHGSEVRHIVGDPFDEKLVGPSSLVWARGSQDFGQVAYVTTDGGTTASPDGVKRKAALLRLELSPLDPGRAIHPGRSKPKLIVSAQRNG